MFSDFYHIGSVISVFLGVVIFIRKEKVLSNYLLACWLIALGVNIFIFHRISDHEEDGNMMLVVNYFLLAFHIPLPYIFTISYYREKRKVLTFFSLLIGIPWLLSTIVFVTHENVIMELSPVTEQSPLIVILLYAYPLLALPFYAILSLFELRKLRSFALNQMSDAPLDDLVIIRNFIVGILLAFVLFVGIYACSFVSPLATPAVAFGSAIVVLSLSVMYAGVFGLQRSDLFTVHNSFAKTDALRKEKRVDVEVLRQFSTRLEQYMKDCKPYLRPRLSLGELSEMTGIPESSLSLVINTMYEKNFYDYINSFRISEFKEKCRTSQRVKFTLTAIAFECGFNSKSAFFEIFKKQTGLTPQQFIKSL